MELGICTFGEVISGGPAGTAVTPEQRLANLLEEIELADRLGLDVFGVGEHHRKDFAVSAPTVVLGAAAARTERIRLSSAVTVLSSDDPVRVFEQFATVDLLSHGRAEIMAGRGSFTESFPLFGQSLDDYDALFAEKLELLLELRTSERVTWSGGLRPAIDDRGVYPRPVQDPLPVWIAVGGTPQSVIRAAVLGLPLTIAIIGGKFERFVPLVELYRESAREAGHDPATLPIAVNTHAFVADTTEHAANVFFPPYAATMTQLGRERGWPPMTRPQFDAMRTPHGALLVGDPGYVTERILYAHELFGNERYLAQFSVGTVPHADNLRAIELFATEVAPAVRAEVARRLAPAP